MQKCFYILLIFSLTMYSQDVSIESFGAKGNGINDDSKAFNNAFRSNVNIIYLTKNKIYKIKNKIILQSNKIIEGNGATIICDEKVDTLFYGLNQNSIKFSNINVIGVSKNANQIAFWMKNVSNFTLENSNLNESNSNAKLRFGVFCDLGCDNMIVTNNKFNNIGGTESGQGYAIHISDSKNFNFSNNTFIAKKGDGRHAIYLSSGSNNGIVRANKMYNFESGAIQLYSYYYQKPTAFNLIEDNIIQNCVNKYAFDGAIVIMQNCNNNIIRKNTIKKSGAYGILLSGDEANPPMSKCMNNEIVENVIDSCENAGIASWGAHFTKIYRNSVSNSNWNKKGKTLCPIGIYDDCNYKGYNEGSEVIDNDVTNNPFCDYAIRIYTNTRNKVIEKGNKIAKNKIIQNLKP